MNRKLILAIIVVMLVSLACSLNINLPNTQVKTGPTVTEDVHVPYLPDAQATADVTLNFGAGEMVIRPGAAGELVGGTVSYNVADFKPLITTDINNVNIKQGNPDIGGIPYINQKVVNKWDLTFGDRPISLVIKAGAYKGDFELGGLSIHKLDVADGASTVNLKFTQPNQVEMVSLDYSTGASSVTLEGLGNANLDTLAFNGGAGTYVLDFRGQLQRDMTVTIDSGVSTVTVIIPEGVAARLTNEGSLISVTTSGGWQQNGTEYTLSGSGHTITIHAKMGAGTLKLETGK